MGYDITAKNSQLTYIRFSAFSAEKHIFFCALEKARNQDHSVSGDGSTIKFSQSEIEQAIENLNNITPAIVKQYYCDSVGIPEDAMTKSTEVHRAIFKEKLDYFSDTNRLKLAVLYCKQFFEEILNVMELEGRKSVAIEFC